MNENFRSYIEAKDLIEYLSQFPENTKVFFFDKDNEGNFSPSPRTSMEYYEDVEYDIIREDESKEEIRGAILAFVREF
jgi:hypothetical protein